MLPQKMYTNINHTRTKKNIPKKIENIMGYLWSIILNTKTRQIQQLQQPPGPPDKLKFMFVYFYSGVHCVMYKHKTC